MRAFAIVAAALLLLNDSFNGGGAQAQVTAEVTAQVTALTNATLIDGTGAAPQRNDGCAGQARA
jgi:hypothetical protein